MTSDPYTLIEQVAGLLADNATTVEMLGAALGTTERDYGASVTVKAADPAVRDITITRARDVRGISHVSLTLAAPQPLEEFQRRYPNAEEMVGDDDAPIQWAIDLDVPNQKFLVRLFADTRLEDVTGFTLLRDIRL